MRDWFRIHGRRGSSPSVGVPSLVHHSDHILDVSVPLHMEKELSELPTRHVARCGLNVWPLPR